MSRKISLQYRRTSSHSFLVLQNAMHFKSWRTHSANRAATSTMGDDLGALDRTLATSAASRASSGTAPAFVLARIAAPTARPGLPSSSAAAAAAATLVFALLARSLAATAALPRGSSRTALLRSALTRLATITSLTGGFHIRNVFSPDGEPSTSMTSHSVGLASANSAVGG